MTLERIQKILSLACFQTYIEDCDQDGHTGRQSVGEHLLQQALVVELVRGW